MRHVLTRRLWPALIVWCVVATVAMIADPTTLNYV